MFKCFKQHRSALAFGFTSSLLATLVGCGGDQAAQVTEPAQTRDALAAETCDLNGTWAIQFVVPVQWDGNPGVAGGSGELVQLAKSVRTVEGNEVTDTLQICGNTVPDYKARVFNEHYGVRFPDELFDSGVLEPITVSTHLSSTEVGADFQSDAAVIQMGTKMNDPLNDAWPEKGVALKSEDTDKDGHPGVTVLAAAGAGYNNPPVNMWRSSRATAFFMAMRNMAQISGKIDHCDHTSGTAHILSVAGKDAIDSHVLGCIKEDGSLCESKDINMVDGFSPRYRVPHSKAGKVKMVRIDDKATCADVRNLQF